MYLTIFSDAFGYLKNKIKSLSAFHQSFRIVKFILFCIFSVNAHFSAVLITAGLELVQQEKLMYVVPPLTPGIAN
jgi:hypothetical protein